MKFFSFRNLMSEFRAFAFKGNMIDLAVAVVIGAAFSGVINSLVKDIIMPSISYVTSAAVEAKKVAADVAQTASAKVGLTTSPTSQPTTNAATRPSTQPVAAAVEAAPPPPPPAAAPAAPPAPKDDKPVDLDWKIGRIQIGHFVAELLNFVIVAFAVFMLVVKTMTAVQKYAARKKALDPTTKECPKCLSTIPIKAVKCAHCTADLV